MHYCRILTAERNRSARETRNGQGAMSGLSLKCVLNTRSIGRSEFAHSLFECAPLVGWVERSDTHHASREVMGFAGAVPILRSVRLLPAASSPALSSTVAALRHPSPFRRTAVVLRFANRPWPPLLSLQFAFTGVAGVRPAQTARLRKGLRICWSIRVGSVQKNGGHRCWHKACIG